MIDLSNNWLRREIIGGTAFYGYTNNIGAGDTDRCWSIRKIATVGSVESVYWNDNEIFNHNAKWSERVANFVTPSGSLGITYSVTTDTFSNAIINSSWSYLTGVNTYKVSVVDQNGILYNNLSHPFNNIYASERITTKLNDNRFTFNGKIGMTYSLTITAVNQIGTTSSMVTITT